MNFYGWSNISRVMNGYCNKIVYSIYNTKKEIVYATIKTYSYQNL